MKKRMAVFALGLTAVLGGLLFVVSSWTTHASHQPGAVSLEVPAGMGYQNDYVSVSLHGYQPGESVTLWQTLPDGTVHPLHDVYVHNDGSATETIFMEPSLPIGKHAISGRGNLSGEVAIVEFSLAAPSVEPDAAVTLSVTSSGTRENNVGKLKHYFICQGSGYVANEPVSFWLTAPDGSVHDLDIVSADQEGKVSYQFALDTPVMGGEHRVTGYGRTSERTAVGSVSVAQSADSSTVFPTDTSDSPSEPEPEPHPAPTDSPAEPQPTTSPNEGDTGGDNGGDNGGDDGDDNSSQPTGEATLEVNPTEFRKNDTTLLIGRGFVEGEVITLSLVRPDGSEAQLYEGMTLTGEFGEYIVLATLLPNDPLPPGSYSFAAYGESSQRYAVAPFVLLP
jgi:hypothetical protein